MYGGQYIYADNYEKSEYNRICSENMDTNGRNYAIKCIPMLAGGYFCGGSTILASYFMDHRTTTISSKIPFVEANTETEFYINYVIQWTIFFHSCFLYVGIETAMSLFENFAQVTPELIQLRLIDAIEAYEKKELSEAQLCVVYKNVLMQSQDYDA